MNKRKTLLVIIIILLGVVGFIYYNNSYSEFRPLIFKDNTYQNIEVDSIFFQNLKIVLDYNKVKYRVNELGKVQVKRKFIADKELVFNYTIKAMDTAWVNTHKK